MARRVLFGSARAIERVPALLGLSSHLLATARRPGQRVLRDHFTAR